MGKKTSERLREKAVSLLLSEKTIEAAARKCGVTKRTMIRWMKEPTFQAEYQEAKVLMLRTATRTLTRNSAKAAETLAKIFLGRPKPNQSANVSAATATLRLALDAFVLEDLDERLRKLENRNDAPI
jgi:transposase-like protein